MGRRKYMGSGDSDVVARDGGVFLRLLREDDIDDRYLSWFRDPFITRYLEAKNITHEEALEHLRYGQKEKLRILYAICTKEDGRHIGNIKIGDINYKAMTSDLVTVVGDRAYWGRGFATAAIKIGVNIAFEKLKLRKLHAGIYNENVGSLKAYTRAGWVVEAKLHQHVLGPNGYCDTILISYFNPAVYPTLPTFPLALV
jgi:RimJ/RimL family protein N-acetyltransferase